MLVVDKINTHFRSQLDMLLKHTQPKASVQYYFRDEHLEICERSQVQNQKFQTISRF